MIRFFQNSFLIFTSILLTGLKCSGNTWTKHEFKVVIEPGARDCFFQPTDIDSVFHVSFQVIRGDHISLYVLDPQMTVLQFFNDQVHGSHQIQKTTLAGDYQLCFDNSHSHFSSKLVSIYILTFHSEKLMEKFQKEKELNETAHIAKAASDKISINLIEIFTHQAMAKFRQARDDYVVEANNSLVLYWSVFQSFFIIICGFIQVYFIKRLFSVSKHRNVTK